VLKRIQSLRNIGRFKNCNPGGLEFGRLTIIYGRNTYGKSTLGDVFASIQENNAQLVVGRKSIPDNGLPQHISLGLLPPSGAKEVSITFDNDTWSGSLPEDLEIRAFDDGFIHRNVFVARQFSRDTKESFSAFVLGEKGVRQAEKIAKKKQERQKGSRNCKQLEKVAFKDVGEVQSFLKLAPFGTLEESDAKLQRLRDDYAGIRKQQQQIQAIQARDQGTVLTWSTRFLDGLKAFNQTLGLGLDDVHKDAKAKVAQHINLAFQDSQGAEQWIRQGARENKGELCQFCGQQLTEEAHNLLDLYRQAFDDNFERHDSAVKQQLTRTLAQTESLPLDDMRVVLAKNTAVFSGYQELQSKESYTSAVSKLAGITGDIETALDTIDDELPRALNRLRGASTKKQESPHIVLEPVEEALICSLERQVQQNVSDYNTLIEICNAEIAVFKGGVNVVDLEQRLKKSVAEGKAEGLNNNRIKLVQECNDYIRLNDETTALGEEIDALEKKLQTDQSDYLEKFFESLNGWFKRFGSCDFMLERGESKQGHTPIYFLKVKYKGQAIGESAISQVFSESDRRALALAVYWTQLQSLPEPVLAQQIVVLDDPLTSFDDQRITAVHRELAASIEKVRQIVVLSHYRHDIEMFFRAHRDHPEAKLLALVAGGDNGTEIAAGNPREFLLTEHEKAHERMTSFRNGCINDYSFGDLRIFFEAELNSRFAAQNAQHKLTALGLGEKIDKLHEHGVISDGTKKECHNWRTVLNPSHHTWTGADLENQRNTVRDFLDFVYNRLIRKQ
jgi:wobble nucleotide-excising tRNase